MHKKKHQLLISAFLSSLDVAPLQSTNKANIIIVNKYGIIKQRIE